MSESDVAQPLGSPIPLEVGIALLAAGLSWVAVPASGVVMHWDADGVAGWSMGAVGYAAVTAIVTFVLGHFVTQLVAAKTGLAVTWAAPAAVGVLLVGYPAFERLWPGVGSFVSAGVLAVAVYFLGVWIGLRGSDRGSGRP
ncbi:hypothetical protein ACFSWE_06785 [Leucobacter albus]|uniref:DUF1648 domain-containing protein n=1 Tax=Leucobacter albus TaxID=272210 RepID=A0ABW3TJ64_9MICO